MSAPEGDPKNRWTETGIGPAGWIALAALLGFLAWAIWYAFHAWGMMAGVGISPVGWLFLVMGVVFTIAVGAGLMGLVFYSSRKGKDF